MTTKWPKGKIADIPEIAPDSSHPNKQESSSLTFEEDRYNLQFFCYLDFYLIVLSDFLLNQRVMITDLTILLRTYRCQGSRSIAVENPMLKKKMKRRLYSHGSYLDM